MNTKVTSLAHRTSMWALGSLATLLVAGSPAFAQHGGGGHGGGGGGGGGGHGGGGGGHASMGGGGGHAGSFGGGRGGFAGARGGFGGGGFTGSRASGFGGAYNGARPMGFSSGHAIVGGRAAGSFAASAGPHYAPRSAYSGLRGGYASRSAASVSAYRNGYAGRPGYTTRSAYVGRPAYGYGWGRGGFGYHRPYWGGGYWHGGFWPRCYYGWSYPWFLGALPAVYATYWWGGVPYYYANNVYYTWNNGSNGYVVTDPPPADGQDSASSDGNYDSTEPGSTGDGGSVSSSGSAEVYAYPKSGQSDEQQATDRYECHKWAVAQSGFDPTRGSQAAGNSADYRRAMVACLDGRGYSSK